MMSEDVPDDDVPRHRESLSAAVPDDHADLPDRIAAAGSLNRLSHALVRHRADPTVLRQIAVAADRLAASIEDQPVRQRRMELTSLPEFDEAVEHGSLRDLLEDGAFVDTFEDSPVSGSANPLSMGLQVGRDGDVAIGRATLAPGWQGAPDRAHGGVVAAIIDEVYGALLPIIGVMAFTGELTVRYVAPCPLGVQLDFRAEKVAIDGRKLSLSCEGRSAHGVFATSTATFIQIDLDQFRAAPD